MEVKNSSGYFKDPVTFEDLSPDTPRVVQCKFENGKFTWPMVMTSAGDPVKIVYKYFTDEEKDLYKAYRGRPVGEKKAAPVQKKAAPVQKHIDTEEQGTDTFINKADAACSAKSLALIKNCDQLIGCSKISGITYALLSVHGSNRTYHVPRVLISQEDMLRLCGGVNESS